MNEGTEFGDYLIPRRGNRVALLRLEKPITLTDICQIEAWLRLFKETLTDEVAIDRALRFRGKTLRSCLLEILDQNANPMKAGEIKTILIDGGYLTNSVHFWDTISVSLGQMAIKSEIARPSRGKFTTLDKLT